MLLNPHVKSSCFEVKDNAGHNSPANGGQVPVRYVSGKRLAKALKAGTVGPDLAACQALQLQTGKTYLHHLTAKQARQVTGTKYADLARVRRESRPVNGGGPRVLYRRNMSDAAVDTVIAQIGASAFSPRSIVIPEKWSGPISTDAN